MQTAFFDLWNKMKEPRHILTRYCTLILIFELLLGAAHFLWPEYEWGQDRRSYFNFDNSLTLASWIATMQLAAVAILALLTFRRDRKSGDGLLSQTSWLWLLGAMVALLLSAVEMTRFHDRLKLLGYPRLNTYERMIADSSWWLLLFLFGTFLIIRLRRVNGALRYGILWLTCWGSAILLNAWRSAGGIPKEWDLGIAFLYGLAYLFGCTLLLLSVGHYFFGFTPQSHGDIAADDQVGLRYFRAGLYRFGVFLGVGGMTFTIIFLQIVLFQMLNIFGDYLAANSIISIALLGISIGGLIGAVTSSRIPATAMITASLLLPCTILLAFGTTVALTRDYPLSTSLLLVLPFVSCSTVITVVLAKARSHLVYCIDLLGAALGALLVSPALTQFREESTLLFLASFTFILAIFFIIPLPNKRTRYGLMFLAIVGAITLSGFATANLKSDWLNIVREKVQRRYPRAEVMFSRSSFVGRYDVIRRKPHHKSIATFDNGRIIDNMRRRPTEEYQIDPRIPHTLMKDPKILILGLSGDGISKTAKALGKKVYGLEINPVVVDLQRNELVEYNHNSYQGIDVSVMDGRSYVEQSNELYDMITLMNAHSARGRTSGRAPSPEYLDTLEAVESYLSHLTDRGVLIVEEPVSRPRREPPVWKFLVTMRQALLNQGSTNPEKHFFVFQWKTKRNNYMQILMKKTPFSDEDIKNLKQWLQEVDDRKKIEARMGRRMGPISCKCTVLYTPDENLDTNYDRILRGRVDSNMLEARNLQVTTDDRPFHFDVDPARPEFKSAHGRTLFLVLALSPFMLFFLRKYRTDLGSALPYLFIVTLTGLGYLLIEVVFIQRFEIFLGYPVVTFCTVLGTMLLFSGIGSLWSGRVQPTGLYTSLAAVVILLLIHEFLFPRLLELGAGWTIAAKVGISILSIAPLAFFMGVPFPFVLRTGKLRFTESAAAILFAINAAASAIAVPLSINISASFGFPAVFQTGIVLYVIVGVLIVALNRPGIQFFANVTSLLVIIMLLATPWVISRPVNIRGSETINQVYAVNYGYSRFREDKIFYKGDRRKRRPFAWQFWIVKTSEKTILVDTGFDDIGRARRLGFIQYIQPTKLLKEFGISPSEITDVVLTHTHWDHMGDLGRYANARIWLQRTEYDFALSSVNESKQRSKGVTWKDVQQVLAAERENRLTLIDGDQEIYPGVTLKLGGAHTPGSQFVIVETLDGPVIIAGDATYLYENNLKHIPIGTCVDHEANITAIREMHGRAASPFYILPGHDPRVSNWFPEITRGVFHITSVPE